MEACKKQVLIVVMMVLGMVMIQVNAQSFCRMPKDGLKACLASVSGDNPVDPNSDCCSAIAKADLQCFCRYKDSGLLSLYGVDPNKCMQLPVKCKVVDSFHC
ncbi:putative lipid-transfer protein DIR1 [Vigna radiata var. radiata]|uniref:Lipid-transfer protein DIR1 n=1 Tax=Vigna radiata var. radiata TaxID=3916 RepID=A0A1S3TIN3_VIGRR|nr:putative lipid-transfer protein DIR1 [Vigna radiata var. radiata]